MATFGDEFRVLRANAANADLLGAKLVAIDGRPVAEVRDTGRTLAGGVPTWRDRTVPLFLESPEQMHALGVARDANAAEYSFITDAGKPVTRRIAADPAESAGPLMPPDMLLYPQPPGGDESKWVSLQPPTIPWSLADAQTAFRWRAAPEIDGMVIQLRRVVDGPGQSISEFLSAMTAKVTADHPRNLVVDMRLNGGGNLNNARDFMKGLPALVQGRIFVLTGPSTFSAAISSVGYLKQASPARVTIVGEEVGDRMVFFAEGLPKSAPNSGMMIGVATQRHDYQNGCKAFTDCHAGVVRFPIALPTFRPEIAAPLTFAAWKAGRDSGDGSGCGDVEAVTRFGPLTLRSTGSGATISARRDAAFCRWIIATTLADEFPRCTQVTMTRRPPTVPTTTTWTTTARMTTTQSTLNATS